MKRGELKRTGLKPVSKKRLALRSKRDRVRLSVAVPVVPHLHHRQPSLGRGKRLYRAVMGRHRGVRGRSSRQA